MKVSRGSAFAEKTFCHRTQNAKRTTYVLKRWIDVDSVHSAGLGEFVAIQDGFCSAHFLSVGQSLPFQNHFLAGAAVDGIHHQSTVRSRTDGLKNFKTKL